MPEMRMPGPLPTVLRFEQDPGSERMSFRCACGESVNTFVCVESGSCEGRCPKCGVFVQVRASKEWVCEGGKPGSGKGAF